VAPHAIAILSIPVIINSGGHNQRNQIVPRLRGWKTAAAAAGTAAAAMASTTAATAGTAAAAMARTAAAAAGTAAATVASAAGAAAAAVTEASATGRGWNHPITLGGGAYGRAAHIGIWVLAVLAGLRLSRRVTVRIIGRISIAVRRINDWRVVPEAGVEGWAAR